MIGENLKSFVDAMMRIKAVVAALPEGYDLSAVYLRLGHNTEAYTTLRATGAALRKLCEQTYILADSLEERTHE